MVKRGLSVQIESGAGELSQISDQAFEKAGATLVDDAKKGYEGADLGILVTRGRAMTERFQLTARSKQWIAGIKSLFSARPLPAAQPTEPAFKIL